MVACKSCNEAPLAGAKLVEGYCQTCWQAWERGADPCEDCGRLTIWYQEDGDGRKFCAGCFAKKDGCVQCGAAADEVASDGKSYCASCWKAWNTGADSCVECGRVGDCFAFGNMVRCNGCCETSSELEPTFGYAGTLDPSPTFAKFDIRDEVCLRVGGFRHGQVVRDRSGHELVVVGAKFVEGVARLWFQPRGLGRRAAGTFPDATASSLRAYLLATPDTETLAEASPADFDMTQDSDGETVPVCSHCRLPVGELAYAKGEDAERGSLHGECLAECMAKQAEAAKQKQEEEKSAEKQQLRKTYDLGWKPERAPRNEGPARKLGLRGLSGKMCGLAFQEKTHSVRLVPAEEPAAAVNLEYLSLALQVRLHEGREPLFSLDPVGTEQDSKHAMHVKRFEPDWLMGTSAGEVLFQADYHLKELSMGEYEQPVVGMRSSLDYATNDAEWNGREWFVVKNAEVHMSKNSVLIPNLEMGVEARQQITTPNGLVDAPVTSPDHPLVRYAEEFTQNFDLIAERKSVVHHLREMAKASVLAKFLLDAEVCLDDSWFDLVEEAPVASCLEVPQLWNERSHTEIHVEDGKIKEVEGGRVSHGVYGGVSFALDQFNLSALKRDSASLMQTAVHRGQRLLAPMTLAAGVSAQSLRAGAFARPAAGVSAVSMGRMGVARAAAVSMGRMGVARAASLRAGGFARAAASVASMGVTRAASLRAAGALRPSGLPVTSMAAVPQLMRVGGVSRPAISMMGRVGAAGVARGVDLNLDRFEMSKVAQAGGDYKSDDEKVLTGAAFWKDISNNEVLQQVFNPILSDRRTEGDRFVPPSTSHAYLEKLRALLEKEKAAQEQRKAHFLSEAFEVGNAGPLFPSSWSPAVKIASPAGALKLCNEHPFGDVAALQGVEPVLDRCTTENGRRFRVYRQGRFEVRTVQDVDGSEIIGAVLRDEAKSGQEAAMQERLVKVTEYVERADGRKSQRFIVLETASGSKVVTELSRAGEVSWEATAEGLEHRTACARVVRSVALETNLTAAELKARCAATSGASRAGGAYSRCRRYAQNVYARARGEAVGVAPQQAGWNLGQWLAVAEQKPSGEQSFGVRAVRA